MVGPNPGVILMFQSTESDGTPPKFDITPENGGWKTTFPLEGSFSGAMLNFGRGIFTVLYQQDQQVQDLFHQQDQK